MILKFNLSILQEFFLNKHIIFTDQLLVLPDWMLTQILNYYNQLWMYMICCSRKQASNNKLYAPSKGYIIYLCFMYRIPRLLVSPLPK